MMSLDITQKLRTEFSAGIEENDTKASCTAAVRELLGTSVPGIFHFYWMSWKAN
jgi:hypothetical protein